MVETRYDDLRVEGAKTLGDAYRHYQAAPESFVAGTQYALDSILQELDHVKIVSVDIIESIAIRTLKRAISGEPQ